MTNSDNAFGTYNKQTQILSQADESNLQNFADVDAAKSWFYTADALAVFDECCTELQWAIVDGTKLKYTMTFGTKGAGTTAADDWAGQFNSRKDALMSAETWSNNGYTGVKSEDHLF